MTSVLSPKLLHPLSIRLTNLLLSFCCAAMRLAPPSSPLLAHAVSQSPKLSVFPLHPLRTTCLHPWSLGDTCTPTSHHMDTAVDTSLPTDATCRWPSTHRAARAPRILDSPSNCLTALPFPTSQSLDSMRSVHHSAIARHLLELEVNHTSQHSLTPPSNLTPLHRPHPIQFPDPGPNPNMTHPTASFPRHLLYLGTKSPYPAPNPVPPLPYPSNKRNSPRLIHVSLIARHGTRNPTNSCLQRMDLLHRWLTSAVSPQPLWLQAWSNILDRYRQDPGSLTFEGEQELHGIGSRFAQVYATSLERVGSTVRLRSSHKARAVSSARSFLEGYLDACSKFDLPQPVTLLDSENGSDSSESTPSEADPSDTEPSDPELSDTDPEGAASSVETSSVSSADDELPVEILPDGRDAILRYFERNVEYATFAMQHKALTRKDLSRGPLRGHAKEMASRISRGLGASSSMDVDLVRSVSEACAFDFAHGRAATSMFCKVLTPKDTAVLEVFEKHHRPFFKGHERFRAVAAPLVADLVESLRASAESPDAPSTNAADLRFAHAETLVPLLLLLGIRTNGLSPCDPGFRQGLSAMSPFAANLAIELYEQKVGASRTHFVRFRLHEKYVECIPALGTHGSTGIVDLKHLLKFFDKILEEGMHHYK